MFYDYQNPKSDVKKTIMNKSFLKSFVNYVFWPQNCFYALLEMYEKTTSQQLDQIYYWRLFTNIQNITTIYKMYKPNISNIIKMLN